MHLRTPVVLALLAAGFAPAAAHATSVRVTQEDYEDERYDDVYSEVALEVTGNTGEANRVVFREPEPGLYVIEDRGSKRPMIAGTDCRRTARTRVVCRPDEALDSVDVDLRDRDDTFSHRGRRGSAGLSVSGGSGRDRISSQRKGLNAAGGSGDDTLVGSTVADSLGGGPGKDVLRGNGGGDALNGGQDDDRAYGGTGDDTLGGNDERGLGRDLLDGGSGSDTADYSDRPSAVRVDLAKRRGGRNGTEDRYRSVENAIGGDGDDTLLGDDRPNDLYGDAGDDDVSGRGGNDTLLGKKVLGGKGDDRVTYRDRRSNCGEGTDTVLLPDEVVYVPRTCELLIDYPRPNVPATPARPVATTDTTLTFELVCTSPTVCRDRRLRLLDTTTPPATTAAPTVLADVAVPEAAGYKAVRVEVPRTGALAPQATGRSLEVAVDARVTFRPEPPAANATGVYRITLDL